jgi:hypothetical protein
MTYTAFSLRSGFGGGLTLAHFPKLVFSKSADSWTGNPRLENRETWGTRFEGRLGERAHLGAALGRSQLSARGGWMYVMALTAWM